VKVLITGAGGQVGRALLDSVPPGTEAVGVSHAQLDIAAAGAVAECMRQHRPEVIINTAAYTAVDRAESEPQLAERVNAEGPRQLAVAARDIGARLIHLSTDFVFDGQASFPYRPDAPTHPLSVYGKTKLAGEQAVTASLPDRAVVLRTAWVYAATGKNFLLTMLRLMGANGSVRVVADQVGTPTAAASLADVIWRMIELPGLRGVHHWTDAGVASWYDFAVAIAEEAALLGLLPKTVTVTPIRTQDYPTPAGRPHYSVLDKTSLMQLGLAPVHWRQSLRAVLAEIRNA
jgi:dTDP-4-dehydrorhamnose reductase